MCHLGREEAAAVASLATRVAGEIRMNGKNVILGMRSVTVSTQLFSSR